MNDSPIGERVSSVETEVKGLTHEIIRLRDTSHSMRSDIQAVSSLMEEAKEQRDRIDKTLKEIPNQIESVRRQNSAQISRAAIANERMAGEAVRSAEKAAIVAEELSVKVDSLDDKIKPIVELKSDIQEIIEFVRALKWLWKGIAALSALGFFGVVALVGHFIWSRAK